MITTAIINKLITGDATATPDEQRVLGEAVVAYPFCALLHHLQRGAPSSLLNELYPANPVVRAIQDLQVWQPATAGETRREILLNEAAPGGAISITDGEMPKELPQQETGFTEDADRPLIQPLSAEDYFLQQGVKVSADIPGLKEMAPADIMGPSAAAEEEQSLLVMMSFAEWLTYLNHKTQREKEDEEEQRALKSSWRRQKLAAAIEEENEEIPDQVFEMAVNSISPGENVATEALAEVYTRQGKKEKAIEMYRKLSLLKPEKSTYFAHKIENLQKEL